MKTSFSLILIILTLNLGHQLLGQNKTAPKKLTEFEFMIGEWQGSSTHFSQNGPQSSDVNESISYALDSTILVIRGTGIDKNGVKQHDALGILYSEKGRYYMHAFTMQGNHVIADVSISDSTNMDWGFELSNGGKIKYQASFTDNSWHESGNYTTSDGQIFPTVKMMLSRK